jgi:hypothetical protein
MAFNAVVSSTNRSRPRSWNRSDEINHVWRAKPPFETSPILTAFTLAASAVPRTSATHAGMPKPPSSKRPSGFGSRGRSRSLKPRDGDSRWSDLNARMEPLACNGWQVSEYYDDTRVARYAVRCVAYAVVAKREI